MLKLTSENVEKVFYNCLYTEEETKNLKEGELPEGVIIALGVQMSIGFEPKRLLRHRENIRELLSQLPIEFQPASIGGGDGWSFFKFWNTKSGFQWTNLHKHVDQLICLGLSTDQLEYTKPRELWCNLPGGQAYVVVKIR